MPLKQRLVSFYFPFRHKNRSFVAILSAILEFVIGFVSNFYNSCALSLRTIQWKNEVSILTNDCVTANYSVSQPPFCPPSWNFWSDLSQTSTTDIRHLGIYNQTSTTDMRCHYAQFGEKNEVSVLINGWSTAKYSVSRPPFVRHLGICNPICVKLLQVMFGVILSNLKEKRHLYLKRFSWGPQTRHTHTHTDTHTHTWRWHKAKCNALHFA